MHRDIKCLITLWNSTRDTLLLFHSATLPYYIILEHLLMYWIKKRRCKLREGFNFLIRPSLRLRVVVTRMCSLFHEDIHEEVPRLHRVGSILNLVENRKPDCGDLNEETSTDRAHGVSVDPRGKRDRGTASGINRACVLNLVDPPAADPKISN